MREFNNEGPCSVAGCTRQAKFPGPDEYPYLCSTHGQRFRDTGDVDPDRPIRTHRPTGGRTCAVQAPSGPCVGAVHCRDLCRPHYERLRRIGDVQAEVPVRYWAKNRPKPAKPSLLSGLSEQERGRLTAELVLQPAALKAATRAVQQLKDEWAETLGPPVNVQQVEARRRALRDAYQRAGRKGWADAAVTLAADPGMLERAYAEHTGAEAPPGPECGTLDGWDSGCRCDECLKARARLRNRRYHQRKREAARRKRRCGTLRGYIEGCRCDACKAVHVEASRRSALRRAGR